MSNMREEELIKMCDCLEVQDRWEFKIGDIYFHDYSKDKRTRNKRVIYDSGLFGVQNGRLGHKRSLFIPRIEDIREWLKDEIYYGLCDDDINVAYFLKLYMDLIHNKSWDGKEWKKLV